MTFPAGIIIIGGGAKLAEFNTKLAETLKMNVRFGGVLQSSVRIANGKINPSDSIDVIAILHGAIRKGAVECLSPVPIVREPEPETQPVIKDKPAKEEQKKKKEPKVGPGFWSGIKGKLSDFTKILEENEEDDSDLFNDDDDDNA